MAKTTTPDEGSGERRVALVTGGNRGIGREVCRQLHARGLDVLLTARDAAAGAAVAAALGVRFHALDVSGDASVDALGRFVDAELGRVDVLVNNAGIYSTQGVLEEEAAELQRQFEVNTVGAFRLARLLVPGMVARGWGRVVNVTSGYGLIAHIPTAPVAYGLAKLGLGGLTRMLAAEVEGRGVLVNAVDPGWVRTDMGGAGAPRSVEKGAETIVWAATLPDDGPHGQVLSDRRVVAW